MTAIPVQVRRNVAPTCRHPKCGAALRLYNSIHDGRCCCHRSACNTEHDYGCVVCGALLVRMDAQLGVCLRCRVVI